MQKAGHFYLLFQVPISLVEGSGIGKGFDGNDSITKDTATAAIIPIIRIFLSTTEPL